MLFRHKRQMLGAKKIATMWEAIAQLICASAILA
jgi:hypothetical protein